MPPTWAPRLTPMMWIEDSDTPSTYKGHLRWIAFGAQQPLASQAHTFPCGFSRRGLWAWDTCYTHLCGVGGGGDGRGQNFHPSIPLPSSWAPCLDNSLIFPLVPSVWVLTVAIPSEIWLKLANGIFCLICSAQFTEEGQGSSEGFHNLLEVSYQRQSRDLNQRPASHTGGSASTLRLLLMSCFFFFFFWPLSPP